MADERSVISDDELATLLDELNRRSVGYLSDEVSQDQDDNLERYLGKPYGDEEEGASAAVSMDVAEVVDWALPDLLEPFVAGRAVEFEPSTQEDDAYCEQATDLVEHVFWRENNGFLLLHDTIKTALIQKIGVTKTLWKEDVKEHPVALEGLSILQLQELQADQSIEIGKIESEPGDPSIYPDGLVYEVEGVRRQKAGCVQVLTLPPEQFKVTQRAADLGQHIEYLAHEREETRSSLLEMGFDRDVVMTLSSDKRRDTDRQDVRFEGEDRREDTSRRKAADVLTLIEEYPLLDLDESGKLKRYQVFRVGKTILDKTELSEHPFDAWTADRIPHRLIGLALADKVKQTQRIKTHLTRQMLDNVYLANNPRTEVPEQAERSNGETIEDLLQYRIGGLIRTRQPGMLRQIEVADRSKTALDAILYMDTVREQQSGITRNGAALDSEAIDPKSATQVRKEDRNEMSRKRLMARMIAETWLVPLFGKILRNLVQYQDQPKWVKLRNDWRPMDPRGWNADMKAVPSVGLGYSNRDENLMAATTIMNVQKELMMGGTGLVQPQHLYAAFRELVEAVGWRFADKYAIDPDSEQGRQVMAQHQEEKPDQKALEAEARTQIEGMKAQHQAQMREFEAQARMREAETKAANDLQVAQIRAQFDREIAQMRIASERQIAELRLAMEENLAIRKQDSEVELANRKMRMNGSSDGGMNGGSVRFGGQIG